MRPSRATNRDEPMGLPQVRPTERGAEPRTSLREALPGSGDQPATLNEDVIARLRVAEALLHDLRLCLLQGGQSASYVRHEAIRIIEARDTSDGN